MLTLSYTGPDSTVGVAAASRRAAAETDCRATSRACRCGANDIAPTPRKSARDHHVSGVAYYRL